MNKWKRLNCTPVSRSIRALLLVLAVVWQTAALFTPWVSSHWAAELAHVAVHIQGDGHHHHDDQTLHLDDNDSGSIHQHADASTYSLGLWQDTALHLVPVPLATVLSRADALWPPPLLDGLLRPPRASS